MSEPRGSNEITGAEDSDGGESVYILDPEDYQQTRRLKAINDAKSNVRKVRKDMPVHGKSKEITGMRFRVAEAVAMYGNELMPIIDEALERGSLEEDDLETEYGTVREFITYDGKHPETKQERASGPDMAKVMVFYRQLERIQRQLGLGLELEEEKGPAVI